MSDSLYSLWLTRKTRAHLNKPTLWSMIGMTLIVWMVWDAARDKNGRRSDRCGQTKLPWNVKRRGASTTLAINYNEPTSFPSEFTPLMEGQPGVARPFMATIKRSAWPKLAIEYWRYEDCVPAVFLVVFFMLVLAFAPYLVCELERNIGWYCR